MDEPDLKRKAEDLVNKARDDSVHVKILTNGSNTRVGRDYLSEPLLSYLTEDEQPDYILKLSNITSDPNVSQQVKIEGENGIETLKREYLSRIPGFVALTNIRVLIIVHGDETDDVVSIPRKKIISINHQQASSLKEILLGATNKLMIETESFTYDIHLENLPDDAISYLKQETNLQSSELNELHHVESMESVFICRECQEEVNPDAKKCPHCGYHPGKGGKGGLWHGTALATSFSPIGWAMMAKGGADELRAQKGIAEETTRSSNLQDDTPEENPIEKIQKLSELNEEGIITDEEFQAKKDQLLESI